MVREEGEQRARELARAAARQRPALRLSPRDDRVREQSRSRRVDGLRRLKGLPEHVALHVRVLVLPAHDVPGAHGDAPKPLRLFAQQLVERRHVPDRIEPVTAERFADLGELLEPATVRSGVTWREARDLLTRALEVEPVRERLAVREDNVRDRVGIDVLEPVLALQAELVVAQQGVRLDERVAGGARIEPVAR